MGGRGSGQWRSSQYHSVDESLVFDSAWLKHQGVLRHSIIADGTAAWTYPDGGRAASVGWHVNTANRGNPSLCLYYLSRRGAEPLQPHEFYYRLDVTSPHFGGTRWWFVCMCGRRCAKLYLPPGGQSFRCRVCLHLTYACQRETSALRCLRRIDKIRARLRPARNGARVLRPKGMHRDTYRWLLERAESLEAMAMPCAGLLQRHRTLLDRVAALARPRR